MTTTVPDFSLFDPEVTIEIADGTRSKAARAVYDAYWDKGDRCWKLDDPTPKHAAHLLRVFPELAHRYPFLVEMREKLAEASRPFDNATPAGLRIRTRALRVAAALRSEGHDWYDYQDLDLGYLAAVLDKYGGAYLGWERGLGKTLGACSLIDAMDAQRTLVVCPNTAKQSVWARELRRFLPGHDVVVLPNDGDKREALLERVRARVAGGEAVPKPVVLVIHYEALSVISGVKRKRNAKGKIVGRSIERGWKKLGDWDFVICDEAHRLKNVSALMTRALKTIPARFKLAMSGSIIENNAEELYSPCNWLFPERFSSKARDWGERFLEYADNGFARVCVGVRDEMLEEFRKMLGVFMTYRRKSDELDLPPTTEDRRRIALSPAQRKVYDALLDDFEAIMPDGTRLVIDSPLALRTKLRQVATGLDAGDGDTILDSSKLDAAIEDILDNPDEAFVVFSWFKAPARELQARLEAKGVGTFNVSGDVKHEDRDEMIERFMNGEGRVFIGTLETLGESVNLQRASQCITLDRSWNPGKNAQAIDRIVRHGQTRATTITHLIAEDTIDEFEVEPTLASKEALRRQILGA